MDTHKAFDLYLVSDATGETLSSVVKAALAQFEDVCPNEHLWTMIRSRVQLQRVIREIEKKPGMVMCTMVDHVLREELEEACQTMAVPFVPVLEPAIESLAAYLGRQSREQPGRQHALNARYFERIEAIQFSMEHDDGQRVRHLSKADVVLVGVSRTSKTPTCVYLANRGVKAANVPLVPGVPLPDDLFKLEDKLVVGLIAAPERLVQIRRNRLLSLKQYQETDYVDFELVQEEIRTARRIYQENGWLTIDVSRRSIEETAAEILNELQRRQDGVP